ncbi:MAG: PQQ-dependent sugar dehydrogenase [Acidobacteria bacterium]|nr:PQQ-dependent sugar dehydrogenase [Acidobacteriota bacterium]
MNPTPLRFVFPIVALTVISLGVGSSAQQVPNPGDPPRDTLPNEPQVFKSAGQQFRVVPMKGLSRPFALAFLPGGDMLITERVGRLRIVRNGVLDPQPIAGIPPVLDLQLKGLQDVAVHPRFAENRLVYFTYYKLKPGEKDVATATLARGRFDGDHALTDVRDLFVADAWCATPSVSRIAFAPDGKIFMTVGVPIRGRVGTAQPDDSQNPASHAGKVLRLNDDGSAPPDNPFAGRPGYRSEIYALGIRNILGLVIHPRTGELWENENGPMGGDEINIVNPGRNYGWPVVSYGRAYTGEATGGTSGPTTDQRQAPGMEDPFMVWVPSIAISGMVFYTGDVKGWQGNLFVGARRGTQLQRIVLNAKGLSVQRETLLFELKQRIGEVRQGPDGLLYLLTDETAGALLRIEPIPSEQTTKAGH